MRFRALWLCILVSVVAGAIVVAAESNENAAAPPPEKDSPPESVYFVNRVMPWVAKAGCNQVQCHGSQRGKGGFRLSMFGAEPDFDYEAITRGADGRRINKVEPAKSLLLLKATGGIPHAGKQPLQLDSAEYKMLVSWIARGAPWAMRSSRRWSP